jgi:hypothetical protein
VVCGVWCVGEIWGLSVAAAANTSATAALGFRVQALVRVQGLGFKEVCG